jgi:hypothetical protein
MLPAGEGTEVEAGEAGEQSAQLAPKPEERGEGPEGEAAEPKGKEAAEQDVLRPLGDGSSKPAASGPSPGAPSHGLGDEATRTSVDVSQYTGGDDSIFRPMEQPDRTSTATGSDPLAARRSRGKQEVVSDISENVRLARSLVAGLVVTLAVTLVQRIATPDSMPNSVTYGGYDFIKSVDSGGGIVGLVMYGAIVGLFNGLLLGAFLTRLKRGPFVGMLVGLMIGYGLTNGVWGYACAAITGIVCGRIATVGLRQVARV